MWHRPRITLLILILIPATGCGGDGLEKVIVSGKVTYDGREVDNGEILFYPIADTKGPVSGGPIHDGWYKTTGKGGVPVGRHRVQIRAFKANPEYKQDDPTSYAGRIQYLPDKFNKNSTLQVEIPSDSKHTSTLR